MSSRSPNQRAQKKLFEMNDDETKSNQYVYLLVDYLNPECQRLFKMKKANPEEYERLRALFTAIQWPDSPEEVAKVIRGESPVSKEIPNGLLTWLQSDKASNNHRENFFYYLADIATFLE